VAEAAHGGHQPRRDRDDRHVVLKRADLYQLFTYMALADAVRGFFVAPCWNEDEPAQWRDLQFGARPPVPGAKLGLLLLNLRRPVHEVIRDGAETLVKFLRAPAGASQQP
jgi:hypothetical protein